jgi:adenosylhomocysteine nucleosidase
MIAVTFALPAESSAFVRKLTNIRRHGFVLRGDLANHTSHLKLRTLCVLHTGVGATECRKRLGIFLDAEQPRFIISSGFCGGTSDKVSPGELLVAENYSDAELRNKARAALLGLTFGKLYSADEVIDPADDRYVIGQRHGAIAIDMETETIARVCAAKNIPMLALRVVSDSPAAPFPAPPKVLFDVDAQRTKFSQLFAHLAREPAAAVRLARFSKQIAIARENLADGLCVLIRAL